MKTRFALCATLLYSLAGAAQQTVPNSFVDGDVADPDLINENFQHVPPRLELRDASNAKIGDVVTWDRRTNEYTILTSTGYQLGVDSAGCIAFAPHFAGRYFSDDACSVAAYDNLNPNALYMEWSGSAAAIRSASSPLTAVYMLTEEGSCVTDPLGQFALPVVRRTLVDGLSPSQIGLLTTPSGPDAGGNGCVGFGPVHHAPKYLP